MTEEFREIQMAFISCICGISVTYDMSDTPPTLECEGCHAIYQWQDKGYVHVGPFKIEDTPDQVFRAEFLQEPAEDTEWAAYVKLAEEYHERCDDFDNSVCTALPRLPGHSRRPSNPRERRAINWNARNVREEICEKALSQGLEDAKKLQEAIAHVARSRT